MFSEVAFARFPKVKGALVHSLLTKQMWLETSVEHSWVCPFHLFRLSVHRSFQHLQLWGLKSKINYKSKTKENNLPPASKKPHQSNSYRRRKLKLKKKQSPFWHRLHMYLKCFELFQHTSTYLSKCRNTHLKGAPRH